MADTGQVKLPGLFQPNEKSLTKWAQMVNEHLETRSGARGVPLERAALQRDLVAISKRITALESSITSETPETLAKKVVSTNTFKDALPATVKSVQEDNDLSVASLMSRVAELEQRFTSDSHQELEDLRLSATSSKTLADVVYVDGDDRAGIKPGVLLEDVQPSGATGTGRLVFSTSPVLVSPNLGIPAALDGRNISGVNTNGFKSSDSDQFGGYTVSALLSVLDGRYAPLVP